MNWFKRKPHSDVTADSGKRPAPRLGEPSMKNERLRDASPYLTASAQDLGQQSDPSTTDTHVTIKDDAQTAHSVDAGLSSPDADTLSDRDILLEESATPTAEHPTAPLAQQDEITPQEGTADIAEKAKTNPAWNILMRGRKRRQNAIAAANATTPDKEVSKGRKTRIIKEKKVKKGGKGSSARASAVALGVTLNNADLWVKLHQDGTGENLNLQILEKLPPEQWQQIRFFRLTHYDKALLFAKNLRGKPLRNAMLREKDISDIPSSFLAHHIRWFTRKSTVQVLNQPVHPLGASLWAYAKKQGWHPEKGVLLYTGIRMQNQILWIYVAFSKNGMGTPQIANINAESERQAFNLSLAKGIFPTHEYHTYEIPPDALFVWLSAGQHQSYHQPGEWFGLKSEYVGKGALAFGIATCVAGGGFWFYADHVLKAAHIRMEHIERQKNTLSQEKEHFLRGHLPEIAYSFHIAFGRDLSAASALWKPGTTVVLADGLPLGVQGSSFQSPIPMPGAAPAMSHGKAQIAITIPESQSLGSGQKNWVSPKILSSVIQQPAVDGFHLQQVIQNHLGGGYVVIFTRGH